MSWSSNPSSSTRRSDCRVVRYPRSSSRISSKVARASPGAARLATGTISGDWSTICTRPSTTSVSFENANRLSRVRAFASVFSRSLYQLGLELSGELLEHAFDLEVRVPDLDVVHPGEVAHRRPIPLDGFAHHFLLLAREAVVDR